MATLYPLKPDNITSRYVVKLENESIENQTKFLFEILNRFGNYIYDYKDKHGHMTFVVNAESYNYHIKFHHAGIVQQFTISLFSDNDNNVYAIMHGDADIFHDRNNLEPRNININDANSANMYYNIWFNIFKKISTAIDKDGKINNENSRLIRILKIRTPNVHEINVKLTDKEYSHYNNSILPENIKNYLVHPQYNGETAVMMHCVYKCAMFKFPFMIEESFMNEIIGWLYQYLQNPNFGAIEILDVCLRMIEYIRAIERNTDFLTKILEIASPNWKHVQPRYHACNCLIKLCANGECNEFIKNKCVEMNIEFDEIMNFPTKSYNDCIENRR